MSDGGEISKEKIDSCVKAEKASERPWPFNKEIPSACRSTEVKKKVAEARANEPTMLEKYFSKTEFHKNYH